MESHKCRFGFAGRDESNKILIVKYRIIILIASLMWLSRTLPAQTADGAGEINTNTVNYLVQHGHFVPSREIVYKTVDGHDLKLHIFDPDGFQTNDARPVFLVFHGGGWVGGNAKGFYPFAAHFAGLGLVGISVDYRLLKRGSRMTPAVCVKDGRSAVRFVRSHATELGINPDKIIVSGGSAGGHVAACIACCQGIDEAGEDITVSPAPDALVLYWPVLDISLEGYGNRIGGEHWQDISPLQLVRPGLPPTLIFHGSADPLVPFRGAEAFHEAMLRTGNRCELVIEPGAKHGYMMSNLHLFDGGMRRTDEFLKSIGDLPQ